MATLQVNDMALGDTPVGEIASRSKNSHRWKVNARVGTSWTTKSRVREGEGTPGPGTQKGRNTM